MDEKVNCILSFKSAVSKEISVELTDRGADKRFGFLIFPVLNQHACIYLVPNLAIGLGV